MEINVCDYVSASLNVFTLIVQSHIVFYVNIPARSLMTECLYKYKISDELLSISSLTTLTERLIETGNKNNCVIPASYQTALISNGKHLTLIIDNYSQCIPQKLSTLTVCATLLDAK